MLTRENELRLSHDVQRRFEEAEKSGGTDWIEVACELQKQVLVEFNIDPTEKALHAYRCAANKHGISLYVKYNRARQGDLVVGSDAPDVPMVLASSISTGRSGGETAPQVTTSTSILDYQKPNRPLVIIAGSIS